MENLTYLSCPSCSKQNRVPTPRLADKPKCGACKQPLFTGHPVSLTGATFDKHISDTTLPIVVDFWAPWCGPCKMMKPAYEQAAAQMEPQVRFADVNTEVEQTIALRYNISAIPTIMMFKNGRIAAQQAGAMGLPGLIQWIRGNL